MYVHVCTYERMPVCMYVCNCIWINLNDVARQLSQQKKQIIAYTIEGNPLKDNFACRKLMPSNGFFQPDPENDFFTMVYTKRDQRQTGIPSATISPNQMGTSSYQFTGRLIQIFAFLRRYVIISGDCRLVSLSVLMLTKRIVVHREARVLCLFITRLEVISRTPQTF